MAALRFLLLPLGLFLCLGWKLTLASPANYSDNCLDFQDVFITISSTGIKASPTVYESNTVYTVWVPVNANLSSVVLRALDRNSNSVGSWQGADKHCNDSVLYYMKPGDNTLIKVQWTAPASHNITEVELQAFCVDFNNTALFSSQKLDRAVMTTTMTSNPTTAFTSKTPIASTSKISTTLPPRISTALTSRTPNNPSTTTTTTKTTTKTTTTSLAHRAFSSSITGAVHILLVFLTSKLLF
ncbi:placenta-expressed transcript 1 protein [Ochotona princeps]|uniref:placenta-expressed transcript 1 protein n=1 Tax=Ochotona princeps TaxID=9978 RepID=UPI00032B2256|nr:placenta-expressed transcript 1 protein [Ochotona princeps]